MGNDLQRQIIHVPENAAADIAANLGIGTEPLRLSYIAGPGDVVSTYQYWLEGKPDPRVPSVTYSSQIYELTKQLGASLQVVTSFPPPKQTTPDVRFTRVTRPAWKTRLQYFQSQARYMQETVKQVSSFDPHVVIVGLDFPTNGWAPLKQGRKLILTAHNTFWPMGKEPTGLKSRLKLKLLEYRSATLDGAVCTSKECARQISTVTGGRIDGRVEHPQIVDRHEVQDRKRMRKLLYLGRIERSKGIFMLLDAFVDLKRQFPDLDLTFVGSGGCDASLSKAITSAGVSDLRFVGRLGSAGVHQKIADSDLVVCPTTSAFPEGLAVVGLEAAAHGIPTLQSSIVPAVDLLGDACKTFKVDSTADLKQALTELINDDDAYSRLAKNLAQVRPRLYDEKLSWGSQLVRVLADLKAI